jgi:hypothetical protein
MIMNLRPANTSNLNTVVEELEGRFDDAQQMAIVQTIVEVLGKADGEAERQAMTDQAQEARKENEGDQEPKQDVMEVDG